jgi:hypothetical protein
MAAPAGIQGAGVSGVLIVNLDPDQDATMVADYYRTPGSGSGRITITRPGIPPGKSTNIYGLNENALPNGSYGGIISSNRPIASLIRTDWGASGGAAIYQNALAGRDIILPVFTGFGVDLGTSPIADVIGRHESLIHVQNTDTAAAATVELELRQQNGKVMLRDQFSVGPGTSATLDLGKGAQFASLPGGAASSLRLSADKPLAVASHVDVSNWDHGVAAFEGLPVDRTARTLFAPLVSNTALLSWMVLLNPGDEDAEAKITYHRNLDASGAACGDAPILHANANWPVPAQGLAIASQAPHGFSRLPAGCVASAMVESDRPLMAVVFLEDPGSGSSAAYTALLAGDAGRRVILPLYRNRHTGDALTTAIQLMNPGDAPAEVELRVMDSTGADIDCPECQATLPPRTARLWYPPVTGGLRDRANSYGSAEVIADQPVLVLVSDTAASGSVDTAIYTGLAMCTEEKGPDAARCQETIHAPQILHYASMQAPPATPTPDPIVSPTSGSPRSTPDPTATAIGPDLGHWKIYLPWLGNRVTLRVVP